MLRFIYANDLNAFPLLKDTMFKHRAIQFRDRLGWEVTVAAHRHERDEYDAINTPYVMCEGEDGNQAGSIRFVLTQGDTITNDSSPHVCPGSMPR